MTETLAQAARTTYSTDHTTGFRRVAGALALPLAFAFILVSNALYAIASTGNGGDTGTSAQQLEFYVAHGDVLTAIAVMAMIGCLLAVPGLLTALRVVRPAKPRLGLWAVMLMIGGYVAYFGIAMSTFDGIALARSGVSPAEFAGMSAAQTNPAAIGFFLLFVTGNLVGTLLLGLAVVLGGRRAGVPWWAGVLIMGWTAGHVVNILGGGEWFAVGGGALEIVGFGVVASVALRTSNAQWASRG